MLLLDIPVLSHPRKQEIFVTHFSDICSTEDEIFAFAALFGGPSELGRLRRSILHYRAAAGYRTGEENILIKYPV